MWTTLAGQGRGRLVRAFHALWVDSVPNLYATTAPQNPEDGGRLDDLRAIDATLATR